MAISYGCIYFASDAVSDAVSAQITSDMSAGLRKQVKGQTQKSKREVLPAAKSSGSTDMPLHSYSNLLYGLMKSKKRKPAEKRTSIS
ncbi:hypothetical protein N7522_009518 [Penicillium canescens]|nr:hypothetical protein N7522_009518 [Penicillium canescens]